MNPHQEAARERKVTALLGAWERLGRPTLVDVTERQRLVAAAAVRQPSVETWRAFASAAQERLAASAAGPDERKTT